VLAAQQPVETTYLLSLTKGRPEKQVTRVTNDDGEVVELDTSKIPESALAAVKWSTIAQLEIGLRQGAKRISMSCSYVNLRRDYSDMLVISLVALFLLIVIAVETWETAYQR